MSWEGHPNLEQGVSRIRLTPSCPRCSCTAIHDFAGKHPQCDNCEYPLDMAEWGYVQVAENTWSSELPEVTQDQVAHVLWLYGYGGYPPGSFVTELLRAWQRADSENWRRLASGFPEYGYLMWLSQRGERDTLVELFDRMHL